MTGGTSVERFRLGECLKEVTRGVGSSWQRYRVVGTTRDGLAPAKERVGKNPERYKLVEPGTIFYNPMRILLGSIALLDEGQEPAITSPDYVVFRTKPGLVHPRWFYYWLRSEEGAAFIRTLTRGAVRERMLFRRLAVAEIDVPPFAAQFEFARAVEFLRRVRVAAETQLEAARTLPAAYLRTVFASPGAQQWPRRPLGDVSEIVSGITLGRRLNGSRTRSVSYLRVANVKDGYLHLTDVYEIEASQAEVEKLRLRRGDLLLTEGGDPDKLERGTVWREELSECIHQNHIFRVRFDHAQFVPDFVSSQMGSPYGKAYFLAHAKQTTGIATINRKILAAFPLMIPSRAEQERIANILTVRMVETERLKRVLESQTVEINAMLAMLLRRAFSGEP